VRTFIFASTLVLLAAAGLVFPAVVWLSVFGALAATGIWIYFSLRDADLDRRTGAPELDDGTLLNMGADGRIDDHHG